MNLLDKLKERLLDNMKGNNKRFYKQSQVHDIRNIKGSLSSERGGDILEKYHAGAGQRLIF